MVFLLDYRAGMYGNSFIFRKFFNEIPKLEFRRDVPLLINKHDFYPLKYGLSLYNFNSINYDGGWGYINEKSKFITKSGQDIFVSSINYYSITEDQIIIGIRSDTNKKELIFTSLESVLDRDPIVLDQEFLFVKKEKIIRLDEDMASFYYYWKLIVLLLVTLIVIYVCVFIFNLLKLYFWLKN